MLRNFLCATTGFLFITVPLIAIYSERLLIWLHTRSADRLPTEEFTWRQTHVLPPQDRVKGSYAAPMRLCDSKDRVPDKYTVYLHHGYTLEEHKRSIDGVVDWETAVEAAFTETERRGPFYAASLHDAGLSSVRADIGVDFIECDTKTFLIEGFEPEMDIETLREDARRAAEMGYGLTYRGERVDPNTPTIESSVSSEQNSVEEPSSKSEDA